VCDLETSRMGAPYIYIYIYDISRLRVNPNSYGARTWRSTCYTTTRVTVRTAVCMWRWPWGYLLSPLEHSGCKRHSYRGSSRKVSLLSPNTEP